MSELNIKKRLSSASVKLRWISRRRHSNRVNRQIWSTKEKWQKTRKWQKTQKWQKSETT